MSDTFIIQIHVRNACIALKLIVYLLTDTSAEQLSCFQVAFLMASPGFENIKGPGVQEGGPLLYLVEEPPPWDEATL